MSYDFNNTDSYIEITVGAEIRERDENDKDRHQKALVTDAKYSDVNYLGASLVNLDHYFQPPADFFYDWSSEVEVNGKRVLLDFSDHEWHFEVYRDELEEAIEARAGEDNMTPLAVARKWRYQAEKADHVPDHMAESLANIAENYEDEA